MMSQMSGWVPSAPPLVQETDHLCKTFPITCAAVTLGSVDWIPPCLDHGYLSPLARVLCFSNRLFRSVKFHLKRFEYDPYQDDLAKIHDRFEFPTELDMSPWLNKDTQHKQQAGDASDGSADAGSSSDACQADNDAALYRLSAVLMHVGGPAAGHYYAYVRYTKPAESPAPPPLPSKPSLSSSWPESSKAAMKKKGQVSPVSSEGKTAAGARLAARREAPRGASSSTTTWVKLDDHRVTKVSEAEVLRDAFGGGGGVYNGPGAELQGLFGQVMHATRAWIFAGFDSLDVLTNS